MTNAYSSCGWFGLILLSCLGGCVAAECREGSRKVGGECVADAAGEGGSSGAGGSAGMAGAGGSGSGGEEDAGLDHDAGAKVDANTRPMPCAEGYALDGSGDCVDIDECTTDNGGCDPLTACTNVPGSRECAACPAGYIGDGVSGCADVDECGTGEHDCDAEPAASCVNTPGAFTCTCPTGYQGEGHGIDGCQDINECLVDNGGCDTAPMVACTNTLGGKTCGACPSGYSGDGIGNDGCVDINECATNIDTCDPAVVCANRAGSFTCGNCPAGYAGDGSQPNGCVPQLATLKVTPGPVTLGFNPSTLAYSVTAGLAARYVEVVATSAVNGATITVDGAQVDEYNSRFHWIGTQEAVVPVVVADPHGRSRTYEVTVQRETSLTQRVYMKSPSAGQYEQFGARTALDGDTLAVSSFAPGLYGGQVIIYVRAGTSWAWQATIDGEDAVGLPQNRFGFDSIDIHGDTLVVGIANQARTNYGSPGAAYVYVRNGTTWSQQTVLYASNSEDGDKFGASVAVHGDRIVVGAPNEDSAGAATPESNASSNSGAVYVFSRSPNSWSQEAYLKAANIGATDLFGTSVDIYRDTVLVGAPQEDGGGTGINPGNDNGRPNSGAAYVFRRATSGWSQLVYVKNSPSTAAENAQLGYAVALGTEDHFAVSAPFAPAAGVYLFGLAAPNVWAQQARLEGPGGAVLFGLSIAMWGPGTVVVGAPGEDSTTTGINSHPNIVADNNSGAAYVFLRTSESDATFNQEFYLKARNSEPSDGYSGSSTPFEGVGVHGDWVTFAATGEDSNVIGISAPGPIVGSDVDVSTLYDSGAIYGYR